MVIIRDGLPPVGGLGLAPLDHGIVEPSVSELGVAKYRITEPSVSELGGGQIQNRSNASSA